MANQYDDGNALPPLPDGELPPMPPNDPDVDEEWAEYEEGRRTEPNNPRFKWPPPTRRLRYKALDNFIAYGIAKAEGILDPDVQPAPHIKLSSPEYRDWISIAAYGGKRKAWYEQRDALVKKISGHAEPLSADKNPYAKKEKVAAIQQAQRNKEWVIEKARDDLIASVRAPKGKPAAIGAAARVKKVVGVPLNEDGASYLSVTSFSPLKVSFPLTLPRLLHSPGFCCQHSPGCGGPYRQREGRARATGAGRDEGDDEGTARDDGRDEGIHGAGQEAHRRGGGRRRCTHPCPTAFQAPQECPDGGDFRVLIQRLQGADSQFVWSGAMRDSENILHRLLGVAAVKVVRANRVHSMAHQRNVL